MISVEDNYSITKECDYKEEHYSVRDNGAIMRHPKNGRVRPSDNKWTYGKKNEKNGYMFFNSSVRIHQVVCTAFHDKPQSPDLVVDHIDTNRCNNRPENLRWVTRLENALNNPITRKRIELCCGSIESFLEDPSRLTSNADPNFSWMRTVTPQEAANCKENLTRWAQQDIQSKPRNVPSHVNDMIFNKQDFKVPESWNSHWEQENPQQGYNPMKNNFDPEFSNTEPDLTQALTPNALQVNWKTPSYFPFCPQEQGSTLEDYYNNLKVGETFANNQYNNPSTVYKFGMTDDKNKIVVICTHPNIKGVPGYALTIITYEAGFFFHTSKGSFFEEIGAEKYFTIEMGQEWTGGDVFDDFC